MFERYNIELDSSRFVDQLGRFRNRLPQAARRMMSRVSQAIRRDTRKNLRGTTLNRQSGLLSRSISYKANTDFTGVIKATAKHASTHERGATIDAKNSRYLTFKIDNQWIKTQSVTIPARPYLKPTIDQYWSSGRAEKIMDTALQELIDRWIEREQA